MKLSNGLLLVSKPSKKKVSKSNKQTTDNKNSKPSPPPTNKYNPNTNEEFKL